MDKAAIAAFAGRWDMLPEGARVLCAVSGGADSVALLHLLRSWPGLTVAAAHFNHRLRGAESDRDEAFVRALCADWGVPFFGGRGDVAGYAGEKRLGIEDAARRLRYAFLTETAERWGADRVATAHNAEDNAETLLLNLVRGTGLRGLGGIAPRRGKIIRPLLQTGREEILAYLEENALPHVEDSSNASDDYARNRLRHHVLPLLGELNPAAAAHMTYTAELLRRDEEALDAQAARFLAENPASDGLPIPVLLALPEAVRARALRRLCGPALERKHVSAIEALCAGEKPHAALDVPGLRLRRERERLYVGGSESPELPDRALPIGSVTALPELGLEVVCEKWSGPIEIHNSFNTFYFQSEKLCGRISVASRRDGEKIALAGRGCTKSLKKLFTEAGLTLAQRRLTPVFRDEKGVIAVYGFGAAERCAYSGSGGAIKIQVMAKDGCG